MERNRHRKNIPFCETRVAQVDQYSWPEHDPKERVCMNGITHPIYSCNGDISYTLPLDQYPRVNEVHPQIAYSRFPHYGFRDKNMEHYALAMAKDFESRRLEGFYQ